jgi:thiamine kinase-like enzyme
VQLVRQQVDRLLNDCPTAAHLAMPLQALLHRLEGRQFPKWSPAPVTLCRLDNNVANYIRRPGLWASVDWEYSGWGDPAFDLANLVTHVAYLDVPAARWGWVGEAYCDLVEDEEARVRIQAYREILLVWWAGRLARYLHEIPSGQDERLASWPDGWQADIRAKFERYVQLSEEALPVSPTRVTPTGTRTGSGTMSPPKA